MTARSIIAAMALWVLLHLPVSADSKRPHPFMADVQEVHVVVGKISKNVERLGVTRTKIIKAIELGLRRNHVPIMFNTVSALAKPAFHRPHLEARITAFEFSDGTEDLFVVVTRLDFWRTVFLMNHMKKVDVWGKWSVSIWQPKHDQTHWPKVRETLSQMVDDFSLEFLRARQTQ